MKVEALLFDLGKVIIDFDLRSMLGILCQNSRRPAAEFETVFRNVDLLRSYETGRITTAQFHEHLCSKGGLRMDFPAFRKIWSDVFMPEILVSEALLKELKGRYPMILVSNTNEAHIGFIAERYGVLDYFHHKVYSFEVGSMKPDPEIFRHAIAVSGRNPERLFFTDDREENILAARELGMQAHQFESEAGLISALNEAGIELGDVIQRDPLLRRS
jgi:FMN phosphatase YigB (HAD superfamily)